MERLTKRIGNSVAYSEFNSNNSDGCYEMMDNCLHKLADYEDAEEQGLIKRLHCKVGDTVYEIQPLTNRITERIVKSIVICNAPNLTIMYKSGYDYSILHEDFEKTIFLTKEEAEQALSEMKGV